MSNVKILSRLIMAASVAILLGVALDHFIKPLKADGDSIDLSDSDVPIDFVFEGDDVGALIPITRLAGKEATCMAKNIYFEARGESIQGIDAVFSVTMNRVRSDKYPNTVCEVVYQDSQFSWTQDKLSDNPKDGDKYLEIYEYATDVPFSLDTVNNATHYYSHTKVTPYWSTSLVQVAMIGNHTFGSMK